MTKKIQLLQGLAIKKIQLLYILVTEIFSSHHKVQWP
jgi:hypothetical protein